MSTGEEPKGTIAPESEHDDAYEEKAKIAADFKADAIEAENAEHNMTVIEADGQNTKPLLVDQMQIFAGQRYSFVVCGRCGSGDRFLALMVVCSSRPTSP